MVLTPKDISIFFSVKSNCCNSSTAEGDPCRNYAKKVDPHKYFKYYSDKGVDVYATTITIGRKWLGRKSADDQYKQFVKDIKRKWLYHGKEKYCYHFELQNNGQLHAHGLHMNGDWASFIECFSDYGDRNTKKEAYQKCRNIQGYTEYIDKENAYPPIHNILKKDIQEIDNILESVEDQNIIV